MLMQSHAGYIHLLRALPPDWAEGSVKGLKARGGYEISIDWKDNRVIRAVIIAERDGEVDIFNQQAEPTFDVKGRSCCSTQW